MREWKNKREKSPANKLQYSLEKKIGLWKVIKIIEIISNWVDKLDTIDKLNSR